MRKFNFKLDNVLSIRENIEKEWEAKLGRANSQCQLVQNKIDMCYSQIADSKNDQVDITQFQIKCIYEARLLQQISNQKQVLKEREVERDKIKEVYLQKSIDRKVIDKLKDKSKLRYKKYSLKEDSLFIDNINSSAKIREKMLEGAN
ncbi:MAG: flagellar export protein FliJ [Spirochaetaceae bacterium]